MYARAWCGQLTKTRPKPAVGTQRAQGYPHSIMVSKSKLHPNALPQGTYRFRVDRMYSEHHSGKYGEILPQTGDRCADSGE